MRSKDLQQQQQHKHLRACQLLRASNQTCTVKLWGGAQHPVIYANPPGVSDRLKFGQFSCCPGETFGWVCIQVQGTFTYLLMTVLLEIVKTRNPTAQITTNRTLAHTLRPKHTKDEDAQLLVKLLMLGQFQHWRGWGKRTVMSLGPVWTEE